MENFSRIEYALSHVFHNKALLEAVFHPPILQNPRGVSVFERLEFLGDRVLGLALAEALYLQHTNEDEGSLALRMAHLGRAETLRSIMQKTGLAEIFQSALPQKIATSVPLEDFCEALLGAVYLDGGYTAAASLVQAFWKENFHRPLFLLKDAKSLLQEYLQERKKALPEYCEIAREGPAHQPLFKVQVTSPSDRRSAVGEGASKQQAEQQAARALVEQLLQDEQRVEKI